MPAFYRQMAGSFNLENCEGQKGSRRQDGLLGGGHAAASPPPAASDWKHLIRPQVCEKLKSTMAVQRRMEGNA
jgi:hypothetical protein